MAESGFIRNGAVAGAVSGAITAAIVYATLPSVDEVLAQMKSMGIEAPVPEEALRRYLEIALAASGVLVLLIMIALGALVGALHGYLYRKTRLGLVGAAVASGLIFTAILVLPNIPAGAPGSKILTNTITGLTYTAALALITMKWDPRRYRESEPRIT